MNDDKRVFRIRFTATWTRLVPATAYSDCTDGTPEGAAAAEENWLKSGDVMLEDAIFGTKDLVVKAAGEVAR